MIPLRIFLLSFLLSISFQALATPIQGLGVSYDVYDFGTYSSNIPWDDSTNNWYVPAHNFKNPVYLYQLNPSLVQQQMRNMRASGNDLLVLHITMQELAACEASGACPTQYNDGIWGYTTDVSTSALRPQQAQNLTNILNYATSIGFRKIFLRFNGGASTSVNSFDETEYQKTWNFISSTHQIAANALTGTSTRLMVDLGGEQMGLMCNTSNGQCPGLQQYVSRLWSDYIYAFGTTDTIGFSAIACPSIIQNGLSWYGATKPNQYAFSNYGCGDQGYPDAGSALVASWNALGSEKNKPIMIIETHFNSAANANSWAAAISGNPTMRITDIAEWMTTNYPSCSGCDRNFRNEALAALQTSVQISNLLPLASAAPTDNTNSALLNLNGDSCTASSATTCATLTIGYAPISGKANWQIWVIRDNGTRSQVACNAGASSGSSPGWMVKTSSYRFDYYKVNSCSDNPTSNPPDATSYISFRSHNLLQTTAITLTPWNSGKCLEVPNANSANGVRVQQSECNGLAQQKWNLVPHGQYFIITDTATGGALDVANGSISNGAIVQQWQPNNYQQQDWSLVPVGISQYQVVNRLSGKCLDVVNGQTSNGALLQQWDCNGFSQQTWAVSSL